MLKTRDLEKIGLMLIFAASVVLGSSMPVLHIYYSQKISFIQKIFSCLTNWPFHFFHIPFTYSQKFTVVIMSDFHQIASHNTFKYYFNSDMTTGTCEQGSKVGSPGSAKSHSNDKNQRFNYKILDGIWKSWFLFFFLENQSVIRLGRRLRSQ